MQTIVLLSGGLDSATVLAMCRAAGKQCHALSFRYGQRHEVELAAAARIARSLGVASHRVAAIDVACLKIDEPVITGQTAKQLGIERTNLYRKLKQLGIGQSRGPGETLRSR